MTLQKSPTLIACVLALCLGASALWQATTDSPPRDPAMPVAPTSPMPVFVSSAPAAPPPQWERMGSAGQTVFVHVPQEAALDRVALLDVATALCTPGQHCSLLYWTDRKAIPPRLPMNDFAAESLAATYLFNPGTGFVELLQHCRINPKPDQCFR